MIVGDLVKIVQAGLIGVIIKTEMSCELKLYWVKLCGKHMGLYPFSINQLEKI